MAGRYPEAATSQLLRNEGGRFVPMQKFEQLGLVSGAVFSDLDGDGNPELIAACEWGPIQIFRNEQGKLTRWDPEVSSPQSKRLGQLTGWWHGVTTGDLDGDGKARHHRVELGQEQQIYGDGAAPMETVVW